MRVLYLDIETTPHQAFVWRLFQENVGLSQLIKPSRVLCVAYRFDDEPMQFVAEWQKGGRRKMIRALHKAMDEADAVVHYNGTSFDEKHLNREFLQAGLKPPSPYSTIDLYRTIKQRFKFASSKLENVARELEIREGKLKTDFNLWRDCMAGDPQARAEMEKYNREDVELLSGLYEELKPWINRHPNVALIDGKSSGCTRCGSNDLQRRGVQHTSAGRFQRYQCKSCGGWSRSATRLSTTQLREAI